ncbi:kinetochore protein NDC80 [Thecamonas trahens ATCC 50062]|uniref:Kinetochore protein NDC80 n=1 Tax=Thecamonas trahens ATCC 50062 TaxID=461836 RepID=A0A0L0DNM9_THETB|nr:kinetochore protein NDC80 [Thecamonas trahens ATCC 50062]KNC53601.1 kinetochore protein NDC80 [Thecamonas trahens ATCC 50062]|eukprot:XP_013761918.1 kinetochore protein NDC80 [Thecamonas trahens ATCC 50062]
MSRNRRMTLGTLSSNSLNARTSLGRSASKRNSMAPKQGMQSGLRKGRRSLAPSYAQREAYGEEEDDYGRGMHTPARSRQSTGSAMGSALRSRRRSSAMMMAPPSSAKKRQSLSLLPNMASRRSLMLKNDPRPVRSKKFQNHTIHTLISYLTHQQYSGAVTPTMLAQPTARDFQHMFQFLYHGFDPYFKFGQRFDAEVAELFMFMAYPFRINKSALASVGSSHTWPTVLAGLGWMVKLLTYEEEILMLEEEARDSGNESGDEIFFNHICRCYQAFLAGADEFEVFEYELAESFELRNKSVTDQIASSRDAVAGMTSRITELTSSDSELASLRKAKAEYTADLSKFGNMLSKLTEHIGMLSAAVEESAAKEASTTSELARLREQKSAIELAIAGQPVSSGDVERMNKEKAALEASVDNLGALREAADNEAWDAEVKLSKASEKLAGLVATINSRIGAVASSSLAANASFPAELRSSLDLAFNANGSTTDDLVSATPTAVEAHITALRSAFGSLSDELHGASLQAKERKEVQEEQLAEKKSAVSALESKINKIELQCTMEKEAAARSLAQLTSDTAKLEEATLRLKADKSAGVTSTSQQVEDLRAAYAETERRCAEEKEALSTCVIDTFSLLVEHKQAIQTTFDNVHTMWEGTIDDLAKTIATSQFMQAM